MIINHKAFDIYFYFIYGDDILKIKRMFVYILKML